MIPAGLAVVALVLAAPAVPAAIRRHQRHARDIAAEIAYWHQFTNQPALYDWADEGDL